MSPAHYPQHDFPHVFEDMPAVHNLLRLRSTFAGSPRIFTRAVTANQFDARVLPEPVGQSVPGTLGEQVDGTIGLQIFLLESVLYVMSGEALFRTSVLNRHSRVYVADPMLSEIRSTPCACGALCAHRAPHAQGVLYVCYKQMLKIAMGALVTGFCCSSTVTIINLLLYQNRRFSPTQLSTSDQKHVEPLHG